MPDFECRLKKYRQQKDLTQEQLAGKVGVRRETIMRLEKAQYNPSLKLAVDQTVFNLQSDSILLSITSRQADFETRCIRFL